MGAHLAAFRIRAMGAYFVRRNSRDELYRRVLERYIAMATEAGVPRAVFPEGGLTRDGRMREAKLGVLDYMLRGYRLNGERDLVFVRSPSATTGCSKIAR